MMPILRFVPAAFAAVLALSFASAQTSKRPGAIQRDIDLASAARTWIAINRHVTVQDSAHSTILHLDDAPGAGMLWTPKIDFSDGEIEVDIRGRDVFQKSFPGIAFRCASEVACDIVYLRPFNYRATDSIRHAHALQYTSYPEYSWERLRADFPGKYETAVVPEPKPDEWTHLRLVMHGTDLQIFVNRAATPSLHVQTLGRRTHGGIGLWVGDLSPGDFANLTISTAR
jgi:hypothetical protein